MNNNLQHNADNRLLEDNKQVQQKVNKYAKKGRLRRVIAVLSAFVLLFTLNQLTFEADTLQRKETCGVEEHRHKKACKDDDGEIVCGQEEHVHTDACYQQRPVDPEPTVFDEFAEIDSQVVLASPMGEEDVSISSETVDGTVSETTMELGDDTDASVEGDASENSLEAEYDLDLRYEEEGSEAAQTEDAGVSAEDAGVSEEGEREYAVDGETLVFLSDVLKGTGIAASDITAVSEIQDDSFVEDHLVIEPVEGVKDEFVLKTVKSYDRIQLGIVTDDAIETAWLTGGVAVEVAADVTEDEQLSEENTTVTDQILNSNENAINETELKQTEVGNEETEVGDQTEAAEDEAAAVEDAQAEDATDTEDVQAEDAADTEDVQAEDATDTEDGQADDISGAEDGQADGEAARQEGMLRRVRLDFSDYVATDTHTVYLFDEAMNAVLVSAAEIAGADGVVVAVEAAEEEEADGEAASDEDGEAATDEDAEGGDAQADAPTEAPAAEVVGETIPVLIITGDGEYTLNGTVYAVAGLVLPGDDAADIEEELADDAIPEEDETAEEAVDARIESVLVGYGLTYDLAEAEDYPLSLRALMDMAEPVYEAREDSEAEETSGEAASEASDAVEVSDDAAEGAEEVAEGGEEAVEAAADVEEEAVEGEGVDYDEALLAVEATDGDWLITPVADFDATTLHIDNITITLLNGRVIETYPAQTFDGATDYLTVHVEAPEGAFPEGTTMYLEDVVDEATLDKLGEPVNEGFTEVQRVHAVDITFRNRAGDEIEPLLPISVVMGVRETAEDEQTTVVHMDSEGNAEVVEAASMADAAAAPLTEDAAQAEEEQDKQEETAAETAAEATVSFTADAFSIYAVVVSKTLETKYLTTSGESFKITLTYTEDAQIPDGAVLAVRELAGEEEQGYMEKTEASLAGNRMVTSEHFFDIKIMDGEQEVQPAAAVEVKIERINDAAGAADAEGEAESAEGEAAEAGDDAAEEAEGQAEEDAGEQAEGEAAENTDQQDDHLIMEGDPVVGAVHFSDEGSDPEAVTARETEEAVIITADSFSVYGVVYTVDFYYGNYEWHIPGEGYITLSDLFKVLHIEADAAQAAEVVFTTPKLLAVKHIEEDTSLSAVMVNLGRAIEDRSVEAGKSDGDANGSNGNVENETQDTRDTQDTQLDVTISAVDWLLVSMESFNTEEKLSVTMTDSTVYEIKVTDPAAFTIQYNVNDRNGGFIHVVGNTSMDTSDFQQCAVSTSGLAMYAVRPRGMNINNYAEDGYHFVKWVVDGKEDYDSNYQIRPGDLTDAHTFTACFAPNNQYLVLYTWGENGTVQQGGAKQFNYTPRSTFDTNVQYFNYSGDSSGAVAVPNSGYCFTGWYDEQNNLISTSSNINLSSVTSDALVHPVFTTLPHYKVIMNYDVSNGQKVYHGKLWRYSSEQNNNWHHLDDETAVVFDDNTSSNYGRACVSGNGVWAEPYPGYTVAYWLSDDGTKCKTQTSGANINLRGREKASNPNYVDKNDTYYVAFFAPQGAKVVRVNWAYPSGAGGTQSGMGYPRVVRKSTSDSVNDGSELFLYYFSTDRDSQGNAVINAIENNSYYRFVGWYNDFDPTLSISEQSGKLYSSEMNLEISNVTDHLNLTPVFTENAFNVWFDGTNGVGGGSAGNNTLYSRINGSGNTEGATSTYQRYVKQGNGQNEYAIITLPSASEVVRPNHYGDTDFVLQGWYCIYPDRCESTSNTQHNYGCYAPGTEVKITGDCVFYADWFRSDYNVGQNSNLSNKVVDTNDFITTHVFDYNNLFNMPSITLDTNRSVIPDVGPSASNKGYEYNREYWTMNGTNNDFIFLSTVSGVGRTLNPENRGERNRNNELGTGGGHYNGTVASGIININGLKNRLFDTSSALGKRYVGTGNYLYSYDNDSGYYYYDSDINAAAYNAGADGGRFYVYNYTNCTNKSTAAKTDDPDYTDFLPFNYDTVKHGSSGVPGDTNTPSYTEMNGEPNYWFGMSSTIKFFLPNAVNGAVNNVVSDDPAVDKRVNWSDHDKEMVYKFAGDDDVWVFLDGELILDLGGVHGKVYGEINFSRGTYTVAQSGAVKINGNGLNGSSIGDMSYGSGGEVVTKTFSRSEGDHTLTLYYLERGSSQSNCAIYFNIAPRYKLRIVKKNDSNQTLAGAKFGIYTDSKCTIAADLKNMRGDRTNIFGATSDNGIVHATELVAGRTYYIKEIQSPTGYPDVSGHVLKLELDARGKATVTAPDGAAWMVNSTGLTNVQDNTWQLGKVDSQPDMYLLNLVNKQETTVTAKKTWSLLDGKDYKVVKLQDDTLQSISIYEDNTAYAKIKLQRYYEDDSGDPMRAHTVHLVTRYFANGDKPSNRDDASLQIYQTETRSVADDGSLTFHLATDPDIGIYSVSATNGDLSDSNKGETTGNKFFTNGSFGNCFDQGDYRLDHIKSDAIIYITIIGTASKESELAGKIHLTNITVLDNAGTLRRIVQDKGFNESSQEVTLDKNSTPVPWSHTWNNLEASDGNGHNYYYYVIETSSSTPQSDANIPGGSFIQTTSSDGLSSGVITAHNTLKAVKVKLRKKDKEKYQPSGVKKDVPLEGGEFYLFTEAGYNGGYYGIANAVVPDGDLIDNVEMGTNAGAKLLSDELGRFYTGFLPMGTYYIVEAKAPDGYQPLGHHIKVVISESGMAYGDVTLDGEGKPNNLENVSMTARKPGSDGIYNLYIDNTMDKGSIQLQKIWGPNDADNGATSVLLKLGVIVNEEVSANDEVVADVLNNPTDHGLTTTQVVEVEGTKYINISKTNGTWPALAINDLPLKRRVAITRPKTDGSGDETVYRAVDAWYFIEEYGYYDHSNVLHKVADKADDWTVSYGTTGKDPSITIGSQAYEVIKARKTAPGTLTVTNSFVTGLTVTKSWQNFTIPEDYKVRVTYVLHRGTTSGDSVTEDANYSPIKAEVYERNNAGTPVAKNATWTKLPKYSPSGAEYKYWATEQKVELLPTDVEDDAPANTSGIVELTSGFFAVSGDKASDSSFSSGRFTQTLTNTVPTATYTAGKDWLTYLANGTKGALTPPAGTTVVFQLKQYKQEMNTPEGTALPSITLNGLKDVTDTPETGEELLSNTSNTADAKEGTAWHAYWFDLPKYYWDSTACRFQEYSYDVEEAQFTYDSITYTVDKTSTGYVVKTGEDETDLWTASKDDSGFTNTLELTEFEFTKQWWDNIDIMHDDWPTYRNPQGQTVKATITVQLSRHLVYDGTTVSADADSFYSLTLSDLDSSTDGSQTDSDGSSLTVKAVPVTVGTAPNKKTVYKFVISGLRKKGSMKIDGVTKTGKWRYRVSETSYTVGPGELYSKTYSLRDIQRSGDTESTGVIKNTKEQTFELPSTGGHGTGMFYILGSILTVLAAVLLIAKKRSDAAGIE